MKPLTPRQQQIYDFICRHLAQVGRPPTRQEIADHFGFKSPNAAQEHLVLMAKKGVIYLSRHLARAIEVA